MEVTAMLLPTKGTSAERALLSVGAEALAVLRTPAAPALAWDRFQAQRAKQSPPPRDRVTFDWFVAALSYLYAIGLVVQDDDGLLRRCDAPS